MHSSTEPAEPIPALPESAPDPYCGTPLGVEAAWCRNGFDVPRGAAATETTMPYPLGAA